VAAVSIDKNAKKCRRNKVTKKVYSPIAYPPTQNRNVYCALIKKNFTNQRKEDSFMHEKRYMVQNDARQYEIKSFEWL